MTMKQTNLDFSNLEYDDDKLIRLIEECTNNGTDFWDFITSNTKELTHGYHGYPAMMIPQLVQTFIKIINEVQSVKTIYDPFTGSGTTLVEGLINNINSFGNDLNPLSRLISKVKTTPIDPEVLSYYLGEQIETLKEEILLYHEIGFVVPDRPTFDKIDFWFKNNVIDELQIIKSIIKTINNEDVKDFFMVCFSYTIRQVSNTRNSEFKLYRMQAEKLDVWNPDVLDVFMKKVHHNVEKNKELFNEMRNKNATATVYNLNSMDLNSIEDNKFDFLITSPPYGDSSTTVAYGQYSRLSLQWLDLKETNDKAIRALDKNLLGGITKKDDKIFDLGSPTLTKLIDELMNIDKKRATEVFNFYKDLNVSMGEIARIMKKNSYQFWVVGNRTVKKVMVPTDQIIIEMFEKYDVKHITTFHRNIPKKRMPKQNSPTNEKGILVNTMNQEIIFVMRKK